MPSPFPGMDPYLEASWRDVHTSLIVYLRESLQESLPPALRARVEERVVLETAEGLSSESFYPDVRIVAYGSHATSERRSVGTATAEPMVLVAAKEPLTEPLIEIIDVSSGNKVVTQIEILSLTNKRPGPNREAYKRKQQEVCDSDASLVEIDLLRAGQHVLAIPLDFIPVAQRTPYMTCVRRGWARGMAEVYAMPLSSPLPAIKIPLRETDADAVVELQPLIARCYRAGGFDVIDYNKDPDPPLDGPDAAWADALLREKGLRTTPLAKPKRKKPPRPRGG